MALTDLELLDLVERAQTGRSGAKGEPGTGIRSIEQSGPETFTINLTDGASREIRFPKPADGEPGPQGTPGPKGERGAPGAKGEMGEAGRNGANGRAGTDGSFVDSVLVNTDGNLLVGLSTGEVVTAGRVVGPEGQRGEAGSTGLPGSPGLPGSSFIAGERPPNDSQDGRDGDTWLDLSSPQMDVYGPKRAGAWGPRRFFMKAPPAREPRPANSFPTGGGAGGGGGGSQPSFEVVLPAAAEILVGTARGEATVLDYKVTEVADNTHWSAGNMNAAANGATAAGEVFTIGAELTGAGGDLDLVWRIVRDVVADELQVYATSPVTAVIKGKFSPYANT